MTRTILIGLDGATFTLLRPLGEDGTMPFLRSFWERGVQAELRSVIPNLTPPAWTSLITGRTPGHHGIYDFVRISREADYVGYRMATSSEIRSETLWSMLSRQGRRVTSLNFPVMFPPRPVAGYLIPGFMPWRHLRRGVYPPDFYGKLTALPGFNPKELVLDLELERKAIQVLSQDEYESWITFHIRREERWLEVVRYLLRTDPSDLTAVLFDGMDKLQHPCWRFIDPSLFPADAAPWERRVRDLCLSYYRRLDGLLEELVALAGEDARVFMASDHGFGSTVELFYVNTWLAQQGYLTWAPGVPLDQDGKLVMLESTRSSATMFDWSRTKAYALTSGGNAVYINVARQPGQPGVPPGEYAAFREELRARLLAFTDPATGGRVVTRALTREEAFPGPEMGQAPDLTLQLRDGGFISILNSETPLRPRREVMGTHRPDGIFLAAGPGIRRNQVVPRLSLLDIVPLILYSLGLPIPSDLEGRLPEEIFEEAYLATTSPCWGGPTQAPGAAEADAPALDAEGEAQLMERLKALGYVE